MLDRILSIRKSRANRLRESMAKINSQIKEVDGKLDDCEQSIKESIASKQAYCASLVNLDKVSLYKYQIKTMHLMSKSSDCMRKIFTFEGKAFIARFTKTNKRESATC